jgi:hypothetical protein
LAVNDHAEGALLDYPLAMVPHLPAIHPERLWAPRIEAFAAGLDGERYFFEHGEELPAVERG